GFALVGGHQVADAARVGGAAVAVGVAAAGLVHEADGAGVGRRADVEAHVSALHADLEAGLADRRLAAAVHVGAAAGAAAHGAGVDAGVGVGDVDAERHRRHGGAVGVELAGHGADAGDRAGHVVGAAELAGRTVVVAGGARAAVLAQVADAVADAARGA